LPPVWQGRGGPVGLQVVDGGGGSFARVGHRGPAWFGAVAVQIVSPLSLRRGGLGLGNADGKMLTMVRKPFEGCEKPQKHATGSVTTGTGFCCHRVQTQAVQPWRLPSAGCP